DTHASGTGQRDRTTAPHDAGTSGAARQDETVAPHDTRTGRARAPHDTHTSGTARHGEQPGQPARTALPTTDSRTVARTSGQPATRQEAAPFEPSADPAAVGLGIHVPSPDSSSVPRAGESPAGRGAGPDRQPTIPEAPPFESRPELSPEGRDERIGSWIPRILESASGRFRDLVITADMLGG